MPQPSGNRCGHDPRRPTLAAAVPIPKGRGAFHASSRWRRNAPRPGTFTPRSARHCRDVPVGRPGASAGRPARSFWKPSCGILIWRRCVWARPPWPMASSTSTCAPSCRIPASASAAVNAPWPCSSRRPSCACNSQGGKTMRARTSVAGPSALSRKRFLSGWSLPRCFRGSGPELPKDSGAKRKRPIANWPTSCAALCGGGFHSLPVARQGAADAGLEPLLERPAAERGGTARGPATNQRGLGVSTGIQPRSGIPPIISGNAERTASPFGGFLCF